MLYVVENNFINENQGMNNSIALQQNEGLISVPTECFPGGVR